MIELRWYMSEDERVLQYRTKVNVVDYGAINPATNDYWKKQEWGPWKNVPEYFPYQGGMSK